MLREWLRAQAISDTHFAAPTLYVWLTQSEMDRVRAGESIATLPEPDAASLNESFPLEDCAVCDRLGEPSRAGRRRAWPSPWASRLSWPDADEARDHLARVELRAEALLIVYDERTTPPTFRASTERGVTAPWSEALSVPDLWAALLFVHARTLADGTEVLSREYVLVSPSMIASVTMGSSEIANELRTERLRLTRLARDAPDRAEPWTTRALETAWASLPETGAPLTQLYASVLTTGAGYPMTRGAIASLVALLDDRSDAFEWHTDVPSEPRPQFFQ